MLGMGKSDPYALIAINDDNFRTVVTLLRSNLSNV